MVMSVTNDELETLLTDSALAAIHADSPLAQIEAALRSLAESVARSDPLRRAVVREATIQRLRQARVGSPAVLADAAFGPEAKRDPATERAPGLRLNTAAPWPEPVVGSDLLDQMAATFSRLLVLSPAAAGTGVVLQPNLSVCRPLVRLRLEKTLKRFSALIRGNCIPGPISASS